MSGPGAELSPFGRTLNVAIEFIPNRAEQPHRWMNGDHVWMTYGPKNTIQSFRSIAATTRTEKPKAKDAKEAPAPALTWSNARAARSLMIAEVCSHSILSSPSHNLLMLKGCTKMALTSL